MEADDSSFSSDGFHLEPFIHQVGGHSSMLQLDESTICKPLITNELEFYQKSPESLKRFMPQFKGVIEVAFSTDEEGYVSLMAHMAPDYNKSMSAGYHDYVREKSKTKVKHRIRLCHSGSVRIESNSEECPNLMFEEGDQVEGQTSGSLMNPWVLRCHQEQIKKMKKSSFITTQKYILLENLVSKYEFPCILDLKMGTRPYGDDASVSKKESLSAKMSTTTTVALGVRIGGIQVYRCDSGHYICHNKYYGRGLTVEGFHQALFNFLHNGRELCKDVIAQLLHKLQSLKELIQSLETFRFFTSSLLIIYNGKEEKDTRKCLSNCFCNPKDTNFCENGNFNGTCEPSHNASSYAASAERFGVCEHSDRNSCNNSSTCDSEKTEKDNLVDVRMIDFAHSTQIELVGSQQNIHSGPDEGYLFGLNNLITQLKTFQQKDN